MVDVGAAWLTDGDGEVPVALSGELVLSGPPEAMRIHVQRPTVDITGAKEALVVGPDDVLVVNLPADFLAFGEKIRDQFKTAGLRDDQYIIIVGGAQLAKAPLNRTNPDPPKRCSRCGGGWTRGNATAVLSELCSDGWHSR